MFGELGTTVIAGPDPVQWESNILSGVLSCRSTFKANQLFAESCIIRLVVVAISPRCHQSIVGKALWHTAGRCILLLSYRG